MSEYDNDLVLEEKPKNDDALAADYPRKPKHGQRYPAQRRSKMSYGCVGIVLGCALLCCLLPMGFLGGAFALAAISENNEVVDRTTETLTIADEDNVNLEVTNVVGSTRIQGEPGAEEITVEIVRRARGLTKDRAMEALNSLEVDVRRGEGNRYIIEVTDNSGSSGWSFTENPNVELRITVPERLNITVTNDVGGLSVRDVEIVDTLNLRNDVGGIEFMGKIGPNGDYNITNNVGGVDVQVDEDSSFRLDATSDVGGIDVALELDDRDESRETVSHSVTGIYGERRESLATFTIHTDVGGISIKD